MTIKTEVIGSLLRSPELLQARHDVAAGSIPAPAFKAIEDRAVDAAIELQDQVGIDVITDGEQRRSSFFGHLIEALDGFDAEGGWGITFRDGEGDTLRFPRPVVVERLAWRRPMCAEEWTYVRARTTRPAKVTLISAQQASAYWEPGRSGGAYPTREEFLADIVSFTRREIAELGRLGCTYVQVDAPQYGALLDPELREGYRQRGADPDRLLETCIELDNAIIDGHPGITFGIHVCRGNNQSKWYSSGDYGPLTRVFRETHFDRFLLEYDDERSGGFEPLRQVPDDRVVVLGLVTTKRPALESIEVLSGRIDDAARHIDRERLALSPQCGFASTEAGNRITPAEQRRKLELVVEAAARL